MKSDNIPMSPCRGDGIYMALHFSFNTNFEEVTSILPLIESALEPFNVKPHPAKHFISSGSKFEQIYGQDLNELRELILENDPSGKFRNDYTDKYLFNGKRQDIP